MKVQDVLLHALRCEISKKTNYVCLRVSQCVLSHCVEIGACLLKSGTNVAPVTLDVRVPGNQTTKALNLSNPPVLQAPKQVGPLGATEFDGLGRGGGFSLASGLGLLIKRWGC